MMLGDPQIASEKEFQEAVVAQIHSRLDRRAKDDLRYAVIEPFGLDMGVFIFLGGTLVLRLVEFKAFTGQRMGGVGFGNRRGDGPQVDLLLLPDDLLVSLGPYVRWCFADLTRGQGTKRYSLITSSTAKQAAMGSVGRGKQNNFRIRDVLKETFTWGEMLERVEGFLLTGS
jgi:hypothetical protein